MTQSSDEVVIFLTKGLAGRRPSGYLENISLFSINQRKFITPVWES
jgi:hypothetical protein